MKTQRVQILFVIITALACVQALSAQQTGYPPFGSFQVGNFDGTNLQDLNVTFSFPVITSAGRGINFQLPIVYNSLIWAKSGTIWAASGSGNFGWQTNLPQGQFSGGLESTLKFKCYNPGPGWFWAYRSTYGGYAYTDPAGTIHGFPISFTIDEQCWGNSGTTAGYATDGSGYYGYVTLNSNGNGQYVLNVTGPSGTAPSASSIVDANGNYITQTVNGSETDYTDSVGHKAAKVITSTTSIQYEFLDGTGTNTYKTAMLTLTAESIKTNFGCSGITEYTSTSSIYLPTELDLPTPSGATLKYVFAYEPTPGSPTTTTGRLQKVTLPAGGSYEYDYGATNDGVSCTDGSIINMTRKVSDGTNTAAWSYVRNASTYTTTMTTPALPDTPNANDTVYVFGAGGEELYRYIYGNSPGTTLLRTIETTWASNGTPSAQTTILEDANHTQSKVFTTFDSNGLLDSATEYDWGQGAPGNAIRTTNYTYNTASYYTSRNIMNLVTSKQITNGQQNTVLYRQDTVYDGVALASCPANVPQHDDTDFPCTMNYRGNPTQVTTYLSPNTPSNGVSKNFTYDWFGNLLTAQINCCQTKTWSYSSATQYSQPDSVTSGTSAPQLTTTYTYDTDTSLQLTATDPDGLVANSSYDFLRRPTRMWQTVGSTTGASVSYSYDDTHFTTTTTAAIDSSKSIQQIAATDGLGRQTKSTTEDVNSNVYSMVSAKYDLLGRPYSASNPYTGSPSYWTTTQFDVLGRPISVTLPDSSATTYAYSANTATVTDPAGKKHESVTDGAGRFSTVFEPDPSNGNSLTLQTTNAYNVLDELIQVTQGSQTRTYNYDALGRLLNQSLPETGNTCFGSVSGSICNTDGYDQWDNLLKRTDARGVLTTYTYDSLNRLIGAAYTIPNGSNVTAMPNVCDPLGGTNISANICVVYGTSASSYNNGRETKMIDGSGSETYTYNNLGQLAQLQKAINSTTYTTAYQYNVAGELTQITYPSGRIVQQSVDPIGRLCEIAPSTTGCGTASNPFATGYAFNTASQITGLKFGNGLYASVGFSADRLQLSCLDYSTTNRNGTCIHDSTTKFGLNYSYGSSGSNDGLVSSATDSIDNGRTANYTYDALYRLSAANTVGSTGYPQWGLSWTYDRYGNRTAQTVTAGNGVPSNSVAISATTNRIITAGYQYDANGNMTNDGYNTLVYDGENRATSATNGGASATYTYDGNRLRVQKAVQNGTTTVYVFSGGSVIAEYDNGASIASPTREYIYNGSQMLAKIDSSGTKYYLKDRLSTRLVTDSSENIVEQHGHYPYGEVWYDGADKRKFTTYERDAETGNDYALARYYISRLGRFNSTDLLSGTSDDPQSLNRYAYSRNDPVNRFDPSGNDDIEDCDDADCGVGIGPYLDGYDPYADIEAAAEAQDQLNLDNNLPLTPPNDSINQSLDPLMAPGFTISVTVLGVSDPVSAPIAVELGQNAPDVPSREVTTTSLGGMQPPVPPAHWKDCLRALHENPNEPFSPALLRVSQNWKTLEAAGAANGVDPALLASIGLQESGFQPNAIQSNGQAVGAFQVDLGQNKQATAAQALDVAWSANFAGGLIAHSYSLYVSTYGPALATAGAIRNYNGTGGVPTSVLLATGYVPYLDVGTNPPLHNYVSSVLNIRVNCF
jgi:RHS repeat-associated protein